MAKESTAILDIKAELQKKAAAVGDRLNAAGGDYIGVKGKQFTVLGEKSNGPLRLVIVDFIAYNAWWDRAYVEGDESPPACFALGLEPKLLVPSPNSPVKQAESCAACEKNVFGTAPNGKGKACGNHRLLAVVQPNADPASPLLVLKVSPTGVGSFDAYVKQVKASFDSMPIYVETDVFFDPNFAYPSLRFANPAVNPNLSVHYGRIADAAARLAVEPDVSQYVPVAPPKGKRKAA